MQRKIEVKIKLKGLIRDQRHKRVRETIGLTAFAVSIYTHMHTHGYIKVPATKSPGAQ